MKLVVLDFRPKLLTTTARQSRAIPASVFIYLSTFFGVFIIALLSEWIKKMTLKKTVEGPRIRQAKLLISNQLSEAWLVEIRKFESNRLRLVVS